MSSLEGNCFKLDRFHSFFSERIWKFCLWKPKYWMAELDVFHFKMQTLSVVNVFVVVKYLKGNPQNNLG